MSTHQQRKQQPHALVRSERASGMVGVGASSSGDLGFGGVDFGTENAGYEHELSWSTQAQHEAALGMLSLGGSMGMGMGMNTGVAVGAGVTYSQYGMDYGHWEDASGADVGASAWPDFEPFAMGLGVGVGGMGGGMGESEVGHHQEQQQESTLPPQVSPSVADATWGTPSTTAAAASSPDAGVRLQHQLAPLQRGLLVLVESNRVADAGAARTVPPSFRVEETTRLGLCAHVETCTTADGRGGASRLK